MFSKHPGFTLAEISIVISLVVIIGLAILTQINPSTQIFKAYDSRRKADLQKIKIAMENYYADHECYPSFPFDTSTNRYYYTCNSDLLKPYLPTIPCDPATKTSYALHLSPADTTCPQVFVVYAKTDFKGDDDSKKIPACPNTFAVYSTNATYSNIVSGCYDPNECPVSYGCVNGACVVISEYAQPYCAPTFCNDSACDPILRDDGTYLNCSSTNPADGSYIRECL